MAKYALTPIAMSFCNTSTYSAKTRFCFKPWTRSEKVTEEAFAAVMPSITG